MTGLAHRLPSNPSRSLPQFQSDPSSQRSSTITVARHPSTFRTTRTTAMVREEETTAIVITILIMISGTSVHLRLATTQAITTNHRRRTGTSTVHPRPSGYPLLCRAGPIPTLWHCHSRCTRPKFRMIGGLRTTLRRPRITQLSRFTTRIRIRTTETGRRRLPLKRRRRCNPPKRLRWNQLREGLASLAPLRRTKETV